MRFAMKSFIEVTSPIFQLFVTNPSSTSSPQKDYHPELISFLANGTPLHHESLVSLPKSLPQYSPAQVPILFRPSGNYCC
jgi:hypothetical protein